MTKRLLTFYISHGGGPWPWMAGMIEGPPAAGPPQGGRAPSGGSERSERGGPYSMLAASLRRMAADAGGPPRAVLMVSAHWEAPVFTVQSNPRPSMIYDYSGFPEHTYRIRYSPAGDLALAARVVQLLKAAGLGAQLDAERGYDHGMYAPMAVAWPNEDMPTVQLSLLTGLNPLAHIELGRALAPLRDEGVLLVGSGLSYHNLRSFGPGAAPASQAFDDWLHRAMALPTAQRVEALLGWERAPSARQAHPREEHLLPLMVAVGAAEEDVAHVAYREQGFMGGVTASSFRFGATAE